MSVVNPARAIRYGYRRKSSIRRLLRAANSRAVSPISSHSACLSSNEGASRAIRIKLKPPKRAASGRMVWSAFGRARLRIKLTAMIPAP